MPGKDDLMRAPAFPTQATWLNVEAPVSLEDLRGQVVLLDFWTYCCINCMHVLPVLERLEAELAAAPFHVIGVHAAKFDQEKDADNVRRAIARHGVRHPVLVDSDHDLWQAYAVRAWPTLVLINSEGKIVQQVSGEPTYEQLLTQVRDTLEADRTAGTLAPAKREVARPATDPGAPLAFPGKVRFLPGAEGRADRLALADTGHHRLLLAALTTDGEGWPRVAEVTPVGGGGVGRQDGNFSTASFRRPQGLARIGETLYLCDTENYLLRAIDLEAGTVRTVAGTGQVTGHPREMDPLQVPLRSPWDCVAVEGVLIVAVAGAHQLWAFDPAKPALFPCVGTGREDHIDGPFAEAALAQPSDLCQIGPNILFADSEVSSIRIADFSQQRVATVVGRGLFDFGDVDGPLDQVRLQHPLGVTFHDQQVYVADTFNNKIKRIDLERQVCETFLGDGSPEILCEPGGLEVGGEFLFIPDTNNHRIRVARLPDGELRTLDLP